MVKLQGSPSSVQLLTESYVEWLTCYTKTVYTKTWTDFLIWTDSMVKSIYKEKTLHWILHWAFYFMCVCATNIYYDTGGKYYKMNLKIPQKTHWISKSLPSTSLFGANCKEVNAPATECVHNRLPMMCTLPTRLACLQCSCPSRDKHEVI